jgi:hypothetical protein
MVNLNCRINLCGSKMKYNLTGRETDLRRPIIIISAIILTLFLSSSCGRLRNPADTGYSPSFKAEANSNEKIKNTTGNKSVQSAKSSDIQMQSLSDEMDKLDSIMNGLDDSADISDTEEIINNLE